MSLIETIQEAISCAIARCSERGSEYEDFTEVLALSTQPDALAWALLEEMAERVEVEVSPNGGTLYFRIWDSTIGPATAKLDEFGNIRAVTEDDTRNLILCLARAIKEQEGRERS